MYASGACSLSQVKPSGVIADENRSSNSYTKGRKRQPPKSGSQNARRALVETEIVWETLSALFLVSSGSLPPTLPSLSSTPRCRWSRKHHSMSRKQDDGERMGTFAAVRVSSNRVERAPSFRYCCRPLPARSPLPAAGDIAPGPGQQLHASDARRVQHLAAKPPAVQGSGLAGAKFELQSQAARRSRPFFVDWSRAARETVTGLRLVPACPRARSKLSSRMADERSVVPSLRNMALAIAVWPRTHV